MEASEHIPVSAHVHAREPRIKPGHGKKTVDLPWAGKGSRFTLHFKHL
jgi:hypothetical protein